MKTKYRRLTGSKFISLLNEASLGDLERNTTSFAPDTDRRQNAANEVQVQQMVLIPYVPNNMLEIKGTINSKGNKYESTIVFENVQYQQEDTPTNVTFTAVSGDEYHIDPISVTGNDVKVRCTCLDFRWRFALYNEKKGSLWGDGPELYQKKTNRPPNNPRELPGMCKHLIRLGQELKNNRIVR